jgi:hypothetical protein
LNAFARFGIQRPNRARSHPAAEQRSAALVRHVGFPAEPLFTSGNSSRNPMADPGYGADDFMAGKALVSERMRG